MPVAQAAAGAGVSVDRLQELLRRARVMARQVGPPASLPAAVRVLAEGGVVASRVPMLAMQVQELTAGRVQPRAVLAVADLFSVPAPVRVIDAGGEDLVVPNAQADVFARVREVARARARVSTAVPIGEVVDQVRGATARAAVWACFSSGWRGHPWPEPTTVCQWVWPRSSIRSRGVPGSVAVRLLAARAYTVAELHAAVADVVAGLPPATARGAVVPPAPVLAIWLAREGLVERHETDELGGAPDQPPTAAVLRARPGLGQPGDQVLLAAVTAAGGQATSRVLAAALRAAGYTKSSAAQLPRASPVLARVDKDTYRVR